MSPMSSVDSALRHRAMTSLHWMARRFGVTREGFTRNAVILIMISTVGTLTLNEPSSSASWGMIIVSGILVLLMNLFFSLVARQRGLKLLRENEEWGAYTNWEEWKWWRVILLYLFPLDFSLTFVGIIMLGEWTHALVVTRVLSFLALFYAISVPEFPPREPRKARAPAHARVGAR